MLSKLLVLSWSVGVFSGQAIQMKRPINENSTENYSTTQEYNLADLGIVIPTLEWSSTGTFQVAINRTFNLENKGPVILVLDFLHEGNRPDNPGYQFSGSFNGEPFAAVIGLHVLPESYDKGVIKQIAIPLTDDGRIYNNQLELTISCQNTLSVLLSASFTICLSSKMVVGHSLLVTSQDSASLPVYPESWQGLSSMVGIALDTVVQFTIENESLLSKSEFIFSTNITYSGPIDLSISLFDQTNHEFYCDESDAVAGQFHASCQITPRLGSNFYRVELYVYGENIWSNPFSLTFENSTLVIQESSGGINIGFGSLEIPFFKWPTIPILGVLVLVLWIMPYTILKYREWKKEPGEVGINDLDDELFDDLAAAEGFAAGDDNDDINDNYEF
jgi:hypothetical protein